MKPETMRALAAGGGYVPAVEDDYSAPIAVKPAGAARMLNLGLSKTYELMRDRELASYSIGRARFVVVASIRDYVSRRLAAAGSARAGA